MSQDEPRAGGRIDAQNVTKLRVLYDMPGTDRVTVDRDVAFPGADGAPLAMDIYRPPDVAPESRTAAVVIVGGFPGDGMLKMLGCHFKDMGSSISWARLIAASGLTAITYTNRAPAADARALLAHLHANSAALGIDAGRIGLWASSGHAPLALSLLMGAAEARPRAAAILYGYTLDAAGRSGVADAARQFGFVTAGTGASVDALPADCPLLFVRAGQDQMPQLNAALDRVVASALARNLPISIVNYPDAPHAFDLTIDTPTSRAVVRQVLGFLANTLSGE